MSEWKEEVPAWEAMKALSEGSHEAQRFNSHLERWEHFYAQDAIYANWPCRIRPRKQYREVTLRLPVPLSVKPGKASYYFSPVSLGDIVVQRFRWLDDQYDRRAFDRGLCFADEESATEYARALGWVE